MQAQMVAFHQAYGDESPMTYDPSRQTLQVNVGIRGDIVLDASQPSQRMRGVLAELFEAVVSEVDLDACGVRLGSAMNAAEAVLRLGATSGQLR